LVDLEPSQRNVNQRSILENKNSILNALFHTLIINLFILESVRLILICRELNNRKVNAEKRKAKNASLENLDLITRYKYKSDPSIEQISCKPKPKSADSFVKIKMTYALC